MSLFYLIEERKEREGFFPQVRNEGGGEQGETRLHQAPREKGGKKTRDPSRVVGAREKFILIAS